MPISRSRSASRLAAITAAAAATLLAPAPTATGADTHDIELDPGVACEFRVGLDITGGHRNVRKYAGKDGNPVTVLSGAAESVLVTNLDSGESFRVKSWGARTKETVGEDGTTTVVNSGHLLLVLFPGDDGGNTLSTPSTTLIAGRAEYTVDAKGVFTLRRISGKTTDICAVLAP